MRRTLAAQPGDLANRYALADALLARGNVAIRDRPEEAESCYREAIFVWPGFYDAICNLGEALVVQAHIAAALGKPVWLLLPQRPDWRWLLQRRDSPWAEHDAVPPAAARRLDQRHRAGDARSRRPLCGMTGQPPAS